MGEAYEPIGGESAQWTVVFGTTSTSRWVSMAAMGHFKHVWAFTYLAGMRAWLVYDVHFAGTRILILPGDTTSARIIAEMALDSRMVAMPVRSARGLFWPPRIGFWCVPAIKHLLGLRCGALRPDALFRHCLRNGGVIIDGRCPEISTAARP